MSLLTSELRDKVELLRDHCKGRGFTLGISTTVRGPDVQARLWCRSLTPEDVARRRGFIASAAPRIAALLKPEYSALGPRMTAHLPGQSWHQLGEALDVYADLGGKAIWNGSIAHAVAEECKIVGLFHSFNEKAWEPRFRHWHVQLRRYETPFHVKGLFDSWRDAERAMLERFDLTSVDEAPSS